MIPDRSHPRILFVANAVLGWATYARQLETALRARQDIVASVLHRSPNRMVMQLVRRHADKGLARIMRPFDPITLHAGPAGRDIRHAVREFRPDIVHFAAHWPAGALLATECAPIFTLALDATRPALTRELPLPGWTTTETETEARTCRAAAHLFPMSSWAARSLETDFGIPAERITVQPPSLASSNWPLPALYRNAIPNILFIGNDLQRKGLYRLVDWVTGPLAGRCHLHVVSSGGPAPRGPNVTFHGRVPHKRLMSEIMPIMDIFCLPTRLDMSPFVLVEAAAAGLPVVTSELCGIPDLVLDGDTGLLVQPDDDAGFVAALSSLVHDMKRRRHMGLRARKLASERFDGQRNFNALIDRLITLSRTGAGHGR